MDIVRGQGKMAVVEGAGPGDCLSEHTVADFIAGSLGPKALRVVEAHLAGCIACRQVVADAAHGSLKSTLEVSVWENQAPPHDPPAGEGQVLAGKYRLEKMLGSGGMGDVFSAVHVELGHHVAIKVLRCDDQASNQRFLREAQTCAQLASEHVVRVFDLGRLGDGAPFIVMELLRGEDLAQVIRHGPVTASAAVSYVSQACEGLAEAHALGVVHRDLKPANLFLVTGPDGLPCIKVLDFGISKLGPDHRLTAGARTLTSTGALVGSPLYMSPEQIQGRKDIDQRADIWSLGVVLYELLTGRRPFRGHTLTAVAVAIATEVPIRPSVIAPGVPSSLDALVLRCIDKNPAGRFASVEALRDALAELVSLESAETFAVRSAPSSAMERSRVRELSGAIPMEESGGIPMESALRTKPRRRGATAAILAALVLLPAVVVGKLTWQRVSQGRSPPPVQLDPTTWGKAGLTPELYSWGKDEKVVHDGAATMRLRQEQGVNPGGDAGSLYAAAVLAAAGVSLDAGSVPDGGSAWFGRWSEAGGYKYRIAVGFRGYRVRFRADVKTDKATTGASLWLRLDDSAGMLALCNMINPVDRRLKGTNDFTRLSCVLDVPESTQGFGYGLILSGPGSAWIGVATLEAVGQDVSESPSIPAE